MKVTLAKFKNRRHSSGVYLVELIMAIAVSGILATALIGSLAENERFATSSQEQVIANNIVQEAIDCARAVPYSALVPGTYNLLVNRTAAGQQGPTNVNPRPLFLDTVNLDWRTPDQRAQGISQTAQEVWQGFTGTATETIAVAPSYPNTYQVTVQVVWQEGTGQRSVTMSTLIAQDGIHVY